MVISKKNVLARLYSFNYEWVSDSYYTPDTNLCHFMRVVLLWLPAKCFVVIALVAVVIIGVIVLPIIEFGLWFYINLVLLIVAVIYFIVRTVQHSLVHGIIPESETLNIITSWLAAIEKKICPFIEIR